MGGNLNVTGDIIIPEGKTMYFENGSDGQTDSISVNRFDNPALCIVGHGTGNQGRSPGRNIHLWDNVIVDSNLKVNNNINANEITCKMLKLGNWEITANNNYLFFLNTEVNQGVQFEKDGGCNRIQAINGNCSGGSSHTRFEG
jgi:hypothetical protein